MTYDELVTAVSDYCENTFINTTERPDMDTMIKQAEQRIYNTVQIANLRKNVTGTITPDNKYLSCPDDFLSTYSLSVYTSASPTATGVAGEYTITVSSASNIYKDQTVTGSGIGTGAVVRNVNGTTITLTVINSGTVGGTINFQGEYLYLLNKDVNFIREAYPSPTAYGKPKHYAIFGPQSTNVNELSFIIGPTPDTVYKAELHYYYYPESIVTAGTTWLGDNFDSALLNATLVEAIRYMKGDKDLVDFYNQMYMQSIALLKNLGDGKQRMDAYRDGQVRTQVQ